MKEYRILIWFPGFYEYYYKLFKAIEVKRSDTECKDKSEFGHNIRFDSQSDFDKIQNIFHANIVILHQINANEAPIDIPEDVYVISYLDEWYRQFYILKKQYFDNTPDNNYFYIPTYDLEYIDKDNLHKIKKYSKKIITAPFATIMNQEESNGLSAEEKRKYQCDISVVSNGVRIASAPYRINFSVNYDNSLSRDVMNLMGNISSKMQNVMMESGKIITDFKLLERFVIDSTDELGLWRYIRDKESFLQVWEKTIFFYLNYNIYANCIVDWLMEKDYNLKLWGGWKGKKYSKHAMGYIKDCSRELYLAYKMSKISVNNTPLLHLHRRTLAIMSSGAMCVSGAAETDELDKKYNLSHYSHFFKNGVNIVVFHSKNELLNQIDYYLKHEGERKKIALAGKKTVMEQELDYMSIVNKAFDDFINRID